MQAGARHLPVPWSVVEPCTRFWWRPLSGWRRDTCFPWCRSSSVKPVLRYTRGWNSRVPSRGQTEEIFGEEVSHSVDGPGLCNPYVGSVCLLAALSSPHLEGCLPNIWTPGGGWSLVSIHARRIFPLIPAALQPAVVPNGMEKEDPRTPA